MRSAGIFFGEAVEEYDIKAAVLFNFKKFVERPSSSLSRGNFSIGIFGDDPFGHVIDDVINKAAAAAKGFSVSAKLLSFAKISDKVRNK